MVNCSDRLSSQTLGVASFDEVRDKALRLSLTMIVLGVIDPRISRRRDYNITLQLRPSTFLTGASRHVARQTREGFPSSIIG